MRQVLVVPVKNFDDFVVGEPRVVYLTERIANLIAMDYLRLLWDEAWGPHATG